MTADGLRLGIAHHFGWAVAVTATPGHNVVDRRRIELIEPGLPTAPIHHEGGPHDLHRQDEPLTDDALAALVADVRAAVLRATRAALDELTAALPAAVVSMSLRSRPDDFPVDIAELRRAPFESRADSIMYLQVLDDVGRERGWAVHTFEARTVEADAARILGERAQETLHGPRARWGPPWTKDHRTALAATILLG